jgi:pyruvate formate lyase activating enzyme
MVDQNDKVRVGGMQPLTLIDFPGHLASVLFLQGCNLRCRFCYNGTLLPDAARERLSWASIIEFLKDRQGFVEGVVFSGGEPCLQPGLLDAMAEVRELGYEIALHTNGYYPEVVEKALQQRLLQFIAVDFKAPLHQYQQVTGLAANEKAFKKLAELIVADGVKHEYRTTFHPRLITESDLMGMADWLVDKKISNFALQKFKHGDALDRSLPAVIGPWILKTTILKLKSRFANFTLRGDDNQDLQKLAA